MKKILLFVAVWFYTVSFVSAQWLNGIQIDSDGNLMTGVSNADGHLEVTGSSGAHAIVGETNGTGAAGIYGINTTNNNFGIIGHDTYGIYGNSMNGYAGYFEGNVYVTGNLDVAGSISSMNEFDPLFSSWDKSSGIRISKAQITDLDTAPVEVELDPLYSGSPAAAITSEHISNWDTAYNWGNYASAQNNSNATFTVCAADSMKKGNCDYIADGVNDEVEIQAAIDACPVISTLKRCKLYLSEGNFYIAQSINIAHGNMLIEGAGQQATRLNLASGINDDMFKMNFTAAGYFVIFRDFEAHGNGSHYSGTGSCSYRDSGSGNSTGKFLDDSATVESLHDVHLEDVWIRCFNDDAINIEDAWGWIFSNTTIEFNNGWAIYANNGKSPQGFKVISSKLISNNKGSIYLNNAKQSQIIGNEISGGKTENDHGIFIAESSLGTNIIGNKFSSSANISGVISAPNLIQVNGNNTIITGNGFSTDAGIYASAIGIGTNVQNTVISNNNFNGIYISSRITDLGSTSFGNSSKYSNNAFWSVENGQNKSIQCTSGPCSTIKITHGLNMTPHYCIVSAGNQATLGYGPLGTESITASDFTVRFTNAVPNMGWATINWFCARSK